MCFLLFQGCSQKQVQHSNSAIILIKTPKIKFYDTGFITKYKDYTHLQIFNFGNVVLDLKVYENEICRKTFECLNNKEFNKKYLSKEYENNFLQKLLLKKNVNFIDKKNNIYIKIIKDNR